jgi:cell division protein FtsB
MINKLNAERKEKETIIQGLKQEINEMEKEKELINSPDHINEYVEKVAREELKMIKPGETIYIDKNKQENGFENSIGN